MSDTFSDVEELWEDEGEDDPKSIFDCVYIQKNSTNTGWICGHCGNGYSTTNATKAVRHVAVIPNKNNGRPSCKRSKSPITPELQKMYNRFYQRSIEKQQAIMEGKRIMSNSLDGSLATATAKYSEGRPTKKFRKSPPSGSSRSSSGFYRSGAIKPRAFGT